MEEGSAGGGGKLPGEVAAATPKPELKTIEKTVTIDGITYKQVFTEDGTIISQEKV